MAHEITTGLSKASQMADDLFGLRVLCLIPKNKLTAPQFLLQSNSIVAAVDNDILIEYEKIAVASKLEPDSSSNTYLVEFSFKLRSWEYSISQFAPQVMRLFIQRAFSLPHLSINNKTSLGRQIFNEIKRLLCETYRYSVFVASVSLVELPSSD